jgi:AraC-like DNA-binding protein
MKPPVAHQIVSAQYGDFHPPGEPRILHSAFVQLEKWTFPNLAAPYWRWYWNGRAGASVLMKKRRWRLTPERIVLIPPETPFATQCETRVTHFYIHFTLPRIYRLSEPVILSHQIQPEERRLVRQFQNRLKGPPESKEWEVSLLCNLLVNRALMRVPEKMLTRRPPEPQIDRALRLLDAAYPRSVPNDLLAREAGLSVNAFLRLFRATTRQTPHQFLLTRRIQEACELMHQPDLSLEDIAEQTGFCDRFHFTRHFKRQLNFTPALFRRRVNLWPRALS